MNPLVKFPTFPETRSCSTREWVGTRSRRPRGKADHRLFDEQLREEPLPHHGGPEVPRVVHGCKAP